MVGLFCGIIHIGNRWDPAAEFNGIHPGSGNSRSKFRKISHTNAARGIVVTIQLDENQEIGSGPGFNFLHDFLDDSYPVSHRTTVFIGPFVGQGGKK